MHRCGVISCHPCKPPSACAVLHGGLCAYIITRNCSATAQTQHLDPYRSPPPPHTPTLASSTDGWPDPIHKTSHLVARVCLPQAHHGQLTADGLATASGSTQQHAVISVVQRVEGLHSSNTATMAAAQQQRQATKQHNPAAAHRAPNQGDVASSRTVAQQHHTICRAQLSQCGCPNRADVHVPVHSEQCGSTSNPPRYAS
jgi:hypothetical protein